MNYKLFYSVFAIYFLLSIFTGCGKKELPRQKEESPGKPGGPVSITGLVEKKATIKYRYKGDVFRDPFIPLDEKKIISPIMETSGEGKKPNLTTLKLKGVIIDSKQRLALFSSPLGSYILRNGKLYDNRNRTVKGYRGTIIDNETVRILTEDKFSKTYKIR